MCVCIVYMGECICVFTCEHVRVYVYEHVCCLYRCVYCAYVSVFIGTCVGLHVYAYMNICVYVCAQSCMCCVHPRIHIYVCLYVYMCTCVCASVHRMRMENSWSSFWVSWENSVR